VAFGSFQPLADPFINPHSLLDLKVFVDASSSWGISIVIGDKWAGWHLTDDWYNNGR
jgi:hypothetical protein